MSREDTAPYSTHLLKNARREECYDREKSDDTHVPDIFLKLVLDTPKRNGNEADEGDPVLLERKGLLRRANGLDLNLTLAVRGARGLV